MSLIHIQNLSKQFKILNRREGLSGAFRDLFSGNYRTVEAVAGISFDIEPGEIVGRCRRHEWCSQFDGPRDAEKARGGGTGKTLFRCLAKSACPGPGRKRLPSI